MRTKHRIGNEVTDRARVRVRFFPIFHFPVPHFSNIFPETGQCFPTCASFDKIL